MNWWITLSAALIVGLNCGAFAGTAPTSGKVTISGFKYEPSVIIVKKGGSVLFVNLDSAPHNVAPEKGASFTKSARMLKNESQTIVFDTLGVQHYFCDIHPSMKGVVKVVE